MSIPANDEVFQRLIEFRLSKVRELAQWLGIQVTLGGDPGVPLVGGHGGAGFGLFSTINPVFHPRWHGEQEARLVLVNSFWATFEVNSERKSEPLEKLMLSWDDRANRLKVLVKP